MSDPMAEIRASFFVECEELLEALQDGLQTMEDGTPEDETVNTVFRAVHSIKGGAGAFGLDGLVGFAHRFETALDALRSGQLTLTGDVLKVFFQGSDVLTDLVRESRDGLEHDTARDAPVLEALAGLVAETDSAAIDEPIDFAPAAISLDFALDDTSAPMPPLPDLAALVDDPVSETAAGERRYVIRFKPDPPLYSSGNEPLYIFRALRDLGPLTVDCVEDDLPPLQALDPEQSHLSWLLTLETGESEAAIREVFDFVEGLCRLEIEPTEAAPEQSLTIPSDTPDPLALTPEDSAPPVPDRAPPAAPAKPGTATSPDTNEAGSRPPAPATATPRATVRVDLDRIDRLVNLVGEIVINQAMLTQSVEAAGLPPNSSVRTGLEEFLQLTRDIQESVMMIRAQPVKSLFQRMSRILREASTAIGKDVRLRTEGENTEVDKTVIERLADPLTHMIRNAVDHGLESNAAREAAGKPREGLVSLRAMHRSGRVVIEVSDDGGGIDREKVLRKAIERGLVPPDAQLSDGEIDALLFLPGFSTAEQVSNLSGRGVGMDVVRSAIQALGGRISISSEAGKGTTFSFSLPLTLAVLDGMVVKVAGETLVIPLNAILETLALTPDDIRPFGPTTSLVKIRETLVPLLDLGADLGYRAPLDDYSGGVVLLIGREDGTTTALVVDTIEDQRQVVIKGLQDSYGRVPGIAAATILGDGQIALILDPVDLVSHASGRTRPVTARPTLPHSTANTGIIA